MMRADNMIRAAEQMETGILLVAFVPGMNLRLLQALDIDLLFAGISTMLNCWNQLDPERVFDAVMMLMTVLRRWVSFKCDI